MLRRRIGGFSFPRFTGAPPSSTPVIDPVSPTLTSVRSVHVETVASFCKTRMTAAAALLIITPLATYNPATDVQRLPQAKVFGETETFVQAQKPAPLILNGSAGYSFTQDPNLRARQAKYFADPETFIQSRQPIAVVWNVYVPAYDLQRQRQAKVFSDPEVFAQARQPAPLLTNGTAGYSFTQDPTLRARQAREFAEPETFPRPWLGFSPATLPATVYNPATDVQRALHAKVFADPESFPSVRPPVPLILNGSGGYSFTQESRRPQAKTFSDPEVFPQRQSASLPVILTPTPYNPGNEFRSLQAKIFLDPDFYFAPPMRGTRPVLDSFTPYNAGTDVRRYPMAIAFAPLEEFASSAPFSQIIINGSAAPPPPPVVVVPAQGSGSPGFVPDKRKKKPYDPYAEAPELTAKSGPVTRPGQVFGEQFPVSPDLEAYTPSSSLRAAVSSALTAAQAASVAPTPAEVSSSRSPALKRSRALTLLRLFMEM